MSDADLAKHAMYPDGELPQFLTVSEIQRRGKMRASYAERQPDATVAEQILQQSGIMSNTQPNLLASSGYANPNMTQGYPQGMSQGMSQGGLQGNMAALPSPPANINPMSGPTAMAASGGVVNLSNGGTGYIPYTQAGTFAQLGRDGRKKSRLEELREMHDLPDEVLLMMIEEEKQKNMNQQVSAYDAATENLPPAFSKDYDPNRPISEYPLEDMKRQGPRDIYKPSDVADNIFDLQQADQGRLQNVLDKANTGQGLKDQLTRLIEISQNPNMPLGQREKALRTAQDINNYSFKSNQIPAGIDFGGSVQGAPLSLIRQLENGKFLAGPPQDQVLVNTEEEANAYLQELGMIDRAGPSAETIASEEAQGLAALLSSAQGNLTEDSRKNLESIDFKQTNPVADFLTKKAPYIPSIHDRGEPFKNIMPAGRSKLDNLKYNLGGGAFADFGLDVQKAAAMDRSPEDQAVYDSLRQGSQDRLQAFMDDPSPFYEKVMNMLKPEKLGGGKEIVNVNDATIVKDQTGVNGQVDPAALMRKRQKAAKGEGEYAGYSIIGLDGGMPAPSGLDPRFNPFGSTASSELRALRGKGKSIPAPDFINPALMAFGAGVADNNMAGGLRDASKIIMQQKQYEAKAAQADLDRDVKILSEAGRIDAYIRTAEAQAQKLAAAGNVDASKLIFDILDYSETRPLNERAAYVYSSMSTMLQQYPQLRSTIVPIMNSAKQDLQKQQAMEE